MASRRAGKDRVEGGRGLRGKGGGNGRLSNGTFSVHPCANKVISGYRGVTRASRRDTQAGRLFTRDWEANHVTPSVTRNAA